MREILIEIERVQIIRKRTNTKLEFCLKCRECVDFITLVKASEVFETRGEDLIRFINTTGSHFNANSDGEINICLQSLLRKMTEETHRLGKQIFLPQPRS
jgi:hypothetical protein